MSRLVLFMLVVLTVSRCACAGPAKTAPPAPSHEVDVGTRLIILDIPAVDERDRSFSLVGLLELEWKDPRVKPGIYLEHEAASALETMWHPDIEIDNEREPRKTENQILTIADGVIHWQERFDAKLMANFDLHRLPFDTQALTIVLQTFSLTDDRVRLVPSATSSNKVKDLSEWSVGRLYVQSHVADRVAGERYSELEFKVEIQRRPEFYFYAVVVPSMLVVLVSFTTLWYDPKQFNAIVGPGVSCMLVLIALNFTVSSYLPRVSYVTTLNRFSLQNYVFVFAAILFNAVTHALDKGGHDAHSDRLRSVLRWLLPISYVISNAIIYVSATGAP